jgi:hypothetical protein
VYFLHFSYFSFSVTGRCSSHLSVRFYCFILLHVGSCLSCGRVTCEMEFKNNGQEKENETEKDNLTETEGEKPLNSNPKSKSNSNSKNTKTNDNDKSKKVIKEEPMDIHIQSGQILCNCFTCGHAVCAPMSVEDLTAGESSLEASAITAYRQKVI